MPMVAMAKSYVRSSKSMMWGERACFCWSRTPFSNQGAASSSAGGSCPPSSEAIRISAPILRTRRMGTGSCIPASMRMCSPSSTGGKMPGKAVLARPACHNRPRFSTTPARVLRSTATMENGVVRSSKRSSPHRSRSIRFNPAFEKMEVRGIRQRTMLRCICKKISSLSANDLPMRYMPGVMMPLLQAAI